MKTIILTSFLLLSGCSGVPMYVDRASGAYDESLSAAELWVCRGASIGSVVRAYGQDDATWAAWRQLCGYNGQKVDRPNLPQ